MSVKVKVSVNVIVYLFVFTFFFLCGSLFRFSSASIVELHLRRRQTTLVVAGSILQESLDMILLGSQFIALNESHVILKKAQLHPEKIIELADFLALSLQFTFSLGTFRGFTCQRSRDRPVVRQSCGINVPALVYLTSENYIHL